MTSSPRKSSNGAWRRRSRSAGIFSMSRPRRCSWSGHWGGSTSGSGISSGKSSLFCFFAKVIDKTGPKEFDRKDGEKGWVATLLVGDETGTIRVVLWDEKAGAALEIATGDVLEVIGRHPGKSTGRSTRLPSGRPAAKSPAPRPQAGMGRGCPRNRWISMCS